MATATRITEADQFPATINIFRKGDDLQVMPGLVKTIAGTRVLCDGAIGRFTRNGDGSQVLKLRWRSKWWEVPTMEQIEEWTFGSVCETPAGDIIEPDADDSWLRLLGLV
jgi:hypothetical protein